MKKLISAFSLFLSLFPFVTFAAYGLTQSLDLELSSSQYASASRSATLDFSSNFTLEAWIKLEQLPSTAGDQMMIIYKGDSDVSLDYRLWINNSDNKLWVSFYSTGQVDATNFNMNEAFVSGDIGTWIHVAAVCTILTPSCVFYKNGVSKAGTSIGTAATSIGDTATAKITVGAQYGSVSTLRYFDGKVSLARIWTTAVSAANVAANMCLVLGSTSNLSAEWTLNNTYNDNSGNSNTLTPINSPVFSVDVPAVCVVAGPTFQLWPYFLL